MDNIHVVTTVIAELVHACLLLVMWNVLLFPSIEEQVQDSGESYLTCKLLFHLCSTTTPALLIQHCMLTQPT